MVLCEAQGVDESDAAAGAQLALNRLIYTHKDDDAQQYVGSSRGPVCAACGIDAAVPPAGLLASHVPGEQYSPDEVERDNGGEYRPEQCDGSGQPPREPCEPVVGFVRGDGLKIFTRVHDVIEAGMAFGNGYLWARPTSKAFR